MPSHSPVKHIEVGTLQVKIYPDRASMGRAAAAAAAAQLRQLGAGGCPVAAIFATGASQLSTLEALTADTDIPWSQVRGFHLDEYVGLPLSHPASFRGYLRRNLLGKVAMREFLEIDGTSPQLEQVRARYEEDLRSANPQLCMLGIGENGHLAFNDPGVADFNDPHDVKIVRLDAACREQQAAEGWFAHAEDVPQQALTLTIPAVLRVPTLIVSVPGARKAAIMRRTLEESISTACPATILRTHRGATVYLDAEAAAELGDYLPAS